MSLKICFIAPYAYRLFHPDDERILTFGGSEVQQYQLAIGLAQDPQCEVSFLVGDFFPAQPAQETVAVRQGQLKVYKTISCRNRTVLLDGLMDFWKLYRAMRATGADIFIIRGGGSLAGKVAMIAKRWLGNKFIYSSAHDRDSNGEFHQRHSLVIRWLFTYALRQADHVICQHQGQQRAFQKNFGIVALPIASMYQMTAAPTGQQREYLLWVSRLQSWKQPEVFATLAQRFPNLPCVMITNSDATEFRQRHRNQKNLTIIERVPLEQMDTYFQKAKVFVNTSTHEGFPNTFVQAAKNGTPIASLTVNPDGILEHHGIGLVASGDQETLAGAIQGLLDDISAWRTMSEHARQYAERHHDQASIVAQYKELFSRVAHS